LQDIAEKVYTRTKSKAATTRASDEEEEKEGVRKRKAKGKVITVPYIELSSANAFKLRATAAGHDLWHVCKCLVTGILPKVRSVDIASPYNMTTYVVN
jgi:hypothetical protein